MNNPYVEVAVGCLNVQAVPIQWLMQILLYLTSVSWKIGRENGAIAFTPFDKNVFDIKPLAIRVANEDRCQMTFLTERLLNA